MQATLIQLTIQLSRPSHDANRHHTMIKRGCSLSLLLLAASIRTSSAMVQLHDESFDADIDHAVVAAKTNSTKTEAEEAAKQYKKALDAAGDPPALDEEFEFPIEENEYISPEDGWTTKQLQCLNDMEDADSTYDHTLNHHEFFIFADILADRMFGMVDALTEQDEWELDELFEHLIVENPKGEQMGIDIFGSSYGQLRTADDAQKDYLKMVCLDTETALRKIGPDMMN